MGKTKTIMKKTGKVLLWIIGSLLVLDLAVVGLLFVPSVQNAVVDFVTKKVSQAWQSEISIGHIHITPSLKVVADEVNIMDMEHKGMIVVDKVSGRLKSLGFSPFRLKFYVIEADGAKVILKKYRGHDSVNIAEWARKFKKDTPGKGFVFQSDKLKLTHSYFLYENEDIRVHQQDSVMDYAFFELADIDFTSRNFLVDNDDISANISKLAFNQYTGFKLLNAAGNFRINSKGLTFDSLALVTPESRIFMDFGFYYDTWKTYSSFVDSVIFKAKVRPSVLQLGDVACFVPSLKGMNNIVKISSVQVDGPVNALKLSDINAHYKEKTVVKGDLAIYDITRHDSLRFDADICNSNLNMRELQSFLLPKGKKIPLPDMVTALGNVKTDVVYQGSMSDFDTQVLLGTALGQVDAGFSLRKPNGAYAYEGDVRTNGFNLGSFLKKEDLLGMVVMNAKIKGTALPKDKTSDFLSSATATLTGHIARADVVRYPLKNVKLNAKYARKKAEGSISSADTNCLFAFDGMADWQRPSPNFQANLKIDNFAPGQMVQRYPQVDSATAKGFRKLILYAQHNPSFNLKINSLGLKMHGTDIDNFNGFAQADTLKCRVDNKRFDIQRLRLVSINNERADHQLILTSNVLNASVKTDYSLRSMVDALKSVAYRYFSQLLPEKSEKLKQFERTNNIEEHYLTFNAETYHLWNVMSMFLPNSFVAPNSKVYFQVNPQKHQDSLLVSSRRIIINRKLFFREVEVSGHERADQSFVLHARCDTFSLAGKNRMDFKNIGLQTDLVNNHLEYSAHWKNPEVISDYTSRLAGEVDFGSRDHIVVRFDPSELYIRDEAWHFEENNALHILNKKIRFDNMSLATSRSHIGVDGTYSDDINDSLTIDIKNLDISILNSYLQQSGMTFGGDVSSKLRLVVMGKSKAYTGRVMISDFVFNDEYFGNVFLLAYLPSQGDVFFTGGISKSDTTVNSAVVASYDYAAFQNESNKSAKLNGYYNTEEKVFKVFAKIDTLHIGFLSPFLASFSNSIRGHASGDLSFIARPDTFYFDGKVNVQDAYMKIAFLNTEYHLVNQEILFDRQGINFDNVVFTDKFNNRGTLKGHVRHHKFKDFKINLDIQTPNLLVLNTPKSSDTPFYGDGFVSGEVSITGDTKTLYFKGQNLQTEKGTVVHLPVSFADRTSESDVISFKVDPTRVVEMEKEETPKSSTEMDFDFSFDITPSAVVELDLDLSAFTGTLRANAAGPLQLTYNARNGLNLYGHAVLSSGIFLMAIKDLITKKFSLNPGGTVIFNGPLDNMVLNASAVYSTTASLSDLISAEMTNASLRRLPVKAYLNLSGKFMENPGIGFSFELPNSTTELSSLFYSAIDTTNTQNMIEQFFSLVMLGKFQASRELASNTTTTTNSDFGLSGIGILTSTVSNFLSKQFKNLDISLNYQNADLDHAAEYSVAASTSLFNNRTRIEGNVGYADDKYNSGNSSTFIGDFSIEQKLNEAGTWRVKVFNVTNQYNQLTSTTPYAQGVALIYKQDFNTGKDIAESFKVKKKDKKKKKKESKKTKEDER